MTAAPAEVGVIGAAAPAGDYGAAKSSSERVWFVFGSSVDAATWESADADERQRLRSA